MITLEEYITASGAHPDRLKSFELTADVIRNAKELLKRVNALEQWLNDNYEPIYRFVVTSGFRPSSVNKALPNAAKRSNHMVGKAVDLMDDSEGRLETIITNELLEKFDLYRESPKATKGWVHLQTTPTSKRTFLP